MSDLTYDQLLAENADLKRRVADAEGEGCTLHKHAPHGKEAEELRKGIERLLEASDPAWRTALHMLLDKVNARDSLSHIRANEELRSMRREWRQLARRIIKAEDVLMDALVDCLDGQTIGSKRIRDALVALGRKRNDLPKDLPPAGARRRS